MNPEIYILLHSPNRLYDSVDPVQENLLMLAILLLQ